MHFASSNLSKKPLNICNYFNNIIHYSSAKRLHYSFFIKKSAFFRTRIFLWQKESNPRHAVLDVMRRHAKSA